MSVQFEFNLLTNVIGQDPSVEQRCSFKTVFDPVTQAACGDIPVMGVRVDFSNCKQWLKTGIGGKVRNENFSMQDWLLDMTVGQPTRIQDLRSFVFDLNKIFVLPGKELPDQLLLDISFLPLDEDLENVTYVPARLLVQKKKPEVISFSIVPSIARESTNININAACVNVDFVEIRGEKNEIILPSSAVSIYNQQCKIIVNNQKPPSRNIPEYTYSITARLGSAVATENYKRSVTIIPNSDWMAARILEPQTPPDYSGDKELDKAIVTVVALVQNEFRNRMWAIGEDIAQSLSYQLWSSEDGLTWTPVEAGGKRLKIPAQYVHSPAVFFNGRLCFVGGSMIDPAKCSSSIYSIDISTGNTDIIKNSSAMLSRCLHNCVVFPYKDQNGTQDNIWVIGGANENGSGMNDVWRYDGNQWYEVAVPQGFPTRCMHNAAVQRDNGGKPIAIWLAGGFESNNGNSNNDVWKYTGQWEPVVNAGNTPVRYAPSQNTYATTITFLNTLPDAPSISLVYNYQRESDEMVTTDVAHVKEGPVKSFGGINVRTYAATTLQNGGKELNIAPVRESAYVLQSIGFNGCIWVLAIYRNKKSFKVSRLFYSCPA